MKITVLPLQEALGRPLAHDLTQIDAVAGTKVARFKKGQVIGPEDVPVLLSMGREHLQMLELEPHEVHEDDAARELARVLQGENLSLVGPDEGRCTLVAEVPGLLLFDEDAVHRVNRDPEWILSTLAPRRMVRAGQPVAGFRIRPLSVTREVVDRALEAASPFRVAPFRPLKVGLVTTGSEIRSGKVSDAFRPRLLRKLDPLGGDLLDQWTVSDDLEDIASAIRLALDRGADLVLCTGGMSVDADDRTPGAIRSVADRVAFQGVPSLPGSMLMLAWAGDKALVGAPACVVYDERTTLDRLLPFLFAGVDVREEGRRWGVGGLCAHCSSCIFPNCAFGQG